jgi:hypothetical protein
MGLVAICKYEAGARWQPAPLSQGQGARELLANSVATRSKPDLFCRASANDWRRYEKTAIPSGLAWIVSRENSGKRFWSNLGSGVRVDESVVLLALDELENAHLLVEPTVPVEYLSRRVAIRRIAIAAAIALPLVTSIVAPASVQTASCYITSSHVA